MSVYSSIHYFLRSACLCWMFCAYLMAYSQEVQWSKTLDDDDFTIGSVWFGDTATYLVGTQQSSSVLLCQDSLFNRMQAWAYDQPFSQVIVLGTHFYACHTHDGFSAVQRMDSLGQPNGAVVLTDGPASHPKLIRWHHDQLLLIDNYDYVDGDVYPRITRLTEDLAVDTSFFLPQNFGLHLYADAVTNDRKELLITGVKEKLQEDTEADYFFMRMDSTLDFEMATAFGSSNEEWIGPDNQSMASFPSGAIVTGEIIAGMDTNITLSLLDFDGQSFSNHVLRYATAAFVSNDAVVYSNESDLVYLLVRHADTSSLLAVDLDAQLQWEAVFTNNEYYHSIYLHDQKLILMGDQQVLAIDPTAVDNALNTCSLNRQTISTLNDVTAQWTSKNYFVQKFGGGPSIETTTAVQSNADVKWNTICPEIQVEGALEGCKGDTVFLQVSGDLSYSWSDQAVPDSVFSSLDTVSLIVDESRVYQVQGVHGFIKEIELTESQDEKCIPDTIPVVYDYISPNGDGKNDYFFIKNRSYMTPVFVSVVNAQNQLIFEDEDYQNDWSPQDVVNGTYFYSVKGNGFSQSGTLVITH